jgi:hypothetical protein
MLKTMPMDSMDLDASMAEDNSEMESMDDMADSDNDGDMEENLEIIANTIDRICELD